MSYPIVVKVADRSCVVVGGGSVAERRTLGLVEAGASVTVVAPDATETIAALDTAGTIRWLRSAYSREHLGDALLVIAATSDPEVNSAVCRDCDSRGVLACCVDDPERGSFLVPAVVRRGAMTLSVSTGGSSPTLSAVLRARLAREYGAEWAGWTEIFARLRNVIQQRSDESRRRAAIEAAMADRRVCAHIEAGDIDAAVVEAQRCIFSQQD